MRIRSVLWDLDDDPAGNVRHCAEHGLTPAEVEHVLQHPADEDVSRSTGLPVVFGDTPAGRRILVVYEVIDADTIYPVTAYEVPPRQRP